jgi:putative transposase
MMLRAFKYRLYPTVPQQIALAQHFGCVPWVYNWGLSKRKEAKNLNSAANHFPAMLSLTNCRRSKKPKKRYG